MARNKLTAAGIDKLQAPQTGQVEIFDELLPGFGVRLSSSGTKAWFVMTRINGKLIRVTLGRHPAMSLGDARKRARQILRLASEGIDPRRIEQEKKDKARQDQANTFGCLAERFMEQHVETNLRPTTVREYRRILFGDDTRGWRNRSVTSIQKRDVLDLLDTIERRGSVSAARLSLAYLRKFFNWCVDREIIDTSPAVRIRPGGKIPSRERVLSADELRFVAKAFEEDESVFGPLFQILLLTGQRRNEVARMTWDELRDLDGEAPVWQMPGSRTKNHKPHLVPMTPAVVTILKSIPRIGPYVFTTTGDTPVSGFSKAKGRVDQRIASQIAVAGGQHLPPWVLHDLRRTMITVMNENLGIQPHVVEAVVNHVNGVAKAGVAGVYNRALYLDDRRLALEKWNSHVGTVTQA